jgi:outer membrane protein TolC
VNKKAAAFLLLILVAGMNPIRAGEEGNLVLTLEDCILRAMRDNLQVAVEVYNPEIAGADLTQATEQFLPSLEFSMGKNHSESPSYWWIQGSETVISRYRDYSLAVTQKIPTGGSFSVSLEGYRSQTNEAFQLINPRFGSTLRFDFTQPLLKDFGFKISRKDILIARNNLEISRNQFRGVLMDMVYRVQEAYWNLVYAIEDVRVKRQSLQLARDLLTKNRKAVEFGKMAPLEILNAEAEVASREADILQAETLIRKQEDLLKTLLNLSVMDDAERNRILPSESPGFIRREISFEAAVEAALHNRPDLIVSDRKVETREINMSSARNRLLPDLSLNLSYWSPGISGDRILYLNDNPYTGVVVGTEKGASGTSLGDALRLLYNNWSVGLTLSFPLGNVLTRAEYVRARMELEQSRVEREDGRRQVLLEVRDAVRDVETNAKRVEAYRVSRELAEKRLEAEVKKFDVGLTTNYFVLQYQEELANARSLEIKALVDYNLALARLDKATGVCLEAHAIQVADFF